MTLFTLPSGKSINLANVTHSERTTWRSSQPDGSIPVFSGLVVHFIGGTALRLQGTDAIVAASKLDLVVHAQAA